MWRFILDFTLLFGLLIGTAQANQSRVGEKVVYDFKKGAFSAEATMEILTYENGLYEIETFIDDGAGGTSRETEFVKEEDIIDKDLAKDLLKNCNVYGGSIKKLKVGSKKYKTCRYVITSVHFPVVLREKLTTLGTDIVYIGKFPVYSFAKANYDDGSKLRLKDFSWP